MKGTKSNNLFEKFRVAELKRPESIFGGNGVGDDDGTNENGEEKNVCVMQSSRYVVIK